MKSIDKADQYFNYSVLRKTVKWSKMVVLYLLNCALFNTFVVCRTLDTNKKVKYKNFLYELGRPWISEVQNQSESILMTFNRQRSKQHQGSLNRIHQADCPGFSKYTDLKKLFLVEREKRNMMQDSVKCVLYIQSEVKLDTFVNSEFSFTKGFVLRNTIQ